MLYDAQFSLLAFYMCVCMCVVYCTCNVKLLLYTYFSSHLSIPLYTYALLVAAGALSLSLFATYTETHTHTHTLSLLKAKKLCRSGRKFYSLDGSFDVKDWTLALLCFDKSWSFFFSLSDQRKKFDFSWLYTHIFTSKYKQCSVTNLTIAYNKRCARTKSRRITIYISHHMYIPSFDAVGLPTSSRKCGTLSSIIDSADRPKRGGKKGERI